MTETTPTPATAATEPSSPLPGRPVSDAARRALAEAAQRRAEAVAASLAPEHGGPNGPEPTRYGDWEKKGLAIDF